MTRMPQKQLPLTVAKRRGRLSATAATPCAALTPARFFELDCVDSGLMGLYQGWPADAVTGFYAQNGICQCRDAVNCPKYIRECQCPPGLYRTCSSCDQMPDEVAFLCPPSTCHEWTCSCFDFQSLAGVPGQSFTADKNTGLATCLTDKQDGSALCPKGTLVTDETQCCNQYASEYNGEEGVCKKWSYDQCLDFQRRPDDHEEPFHCGIRSCCPLEGNENMYGDDDSGAGNEQGSSLVFCTADYNHGEIRLECTIDPTAQDGFYVGTFAAQNGPRRAGEPADTFDLALWETRVDARLRQTLAAADLDLETLRELSDYQYMDTAYNELREAGIAKPGDRVKIIDTLRAMKRMPLPLHGGGNREGADDLLMRGADDLRAQLLNQTMATPGKPVRVELDEVRMLLLKQLLPKLPRIARKAKLLKLESAAKVAAPTPSDSQTVLAPAMRRVLQDDSYSGGYGLLKMKVAFSYSTEHHKFKEMLFKCGGPGEDDQSGGQSRPQGACDACHPHDDPCWYSAFGYQDAILNALNSDGSGYNVEVARVTQEQGQDFHYIFLKVTSSTNPNGLFDFAALESAMSQSYPDIAAAASCCGQYDSFIYDWTGCAPDLQECENCEGQQEYCPGLMQVMTTYEVTPWICGDGVLQTNSPIHDDDAQEECDLGQALNHRYSPCLDGEITEGDYDRDRVCRCNDALGFSLQQGACQCKHDARLISVHASESDDTQGAENTIRFKVGFYEEIHATTGNPMVVEFVGLTGSSTVGSQVDVTCLQPGPSDCTGVLGASKSIDDISGEHDAWDWGKGDWDQGTGTLKFTLVRELLEDDAFSVSMMIEFGLTNSDTAQRGVRPYVRICGKSSWQADATYSGFKPQDYSGQALLASNKIFYSAGTACEPSCGLTRIRSAGSAPEVVAFLTFTSLEEALIVTIGDAVVGRDVTQVEAGALPLPGSTVPCNLVTPDDPQPTCSTFVGPADSLIKVHSASGKGLPFGSQLQLMINTSASSAYRSRGGCYTTSTSTLTVCLPGNVGLYLFNETTKRWLADSAPTNGMMVAWTPSLTFENPCNNMSAGGSFCIAADDTGKYSGQQCPSPDDRCVILEALNVYRRQGSANKQYQCQSTASEQFGLSDICAESTVDEDCGDDDCDSWSVKCCEGPLCNDDEGRGSRLEQCSKDSKTFAALSTSPCYDYEGVGAAGGDRICFNTWTQDGPKPATSATKIVLGDGTLSKRPAVAPTDRPALKSFADVAKSIKVDGDGPPSSLLLRAGWAQLCPDSYCDPNTGACKCDGNIPDVEWFAPRFGHTAKTLGTTSILLYGGIGCKTFSVISVGGKNQSRCTELTLLDDLWEFNVVKALSGQQPFYKLETSPRLKGLVGMAAATLPSADNKLLLFGGSIIFHAMTLVSEQLATPGTGTFEVRLLEFRAGKAGSAALPNLGEISSSASVHNNTHVVLFGGFVGNALSAVTFTYELAAASPQLGMAGLLPLSQAAPPPRAFPGLVKPDEDTLVMFGGYSGGSGRSDLWKLNVVSSRWTLLEQEDKTDASKPYPTAFGAFSYFYVASAQGQDLILTTNMGLKDGYKAGVSFARGGAPDAQGLYQVTDLCRWTQWLPSGVSSGVWNRMLPNDISSLCCSTSQPGPGRAVQKMCTDAQRWNTDACAPQARAMHTLTNGNFVAGSPSLLIYGGLQREGVALKELWYMDLAVGMIMMPKFWVYMSGMPSRSEWQADDALVSADLKAIVVKLAALSTQSEFYWRNHNPVTWADLEIYDVALEEQRDSLTSFTFKAYVRDESAEPSSDWLFFAFNPDIATGYFAAALGAASLQTTVFNNAMITCPEGGSYVGQPFCGWARDRDESGTMIADVGLQTKKYDDTSACNPTEPGSKCARGICMGSTVATQGLVTTDEHDQKQFCFHQSNKVSTTPCTVTTKTVDADGVEAVSTSETSEYRCSLPGRGTGTGLKK